MALTQAQRIQISKKIIEIPKLNAALDGIKANLDEQKIKLQDEDGGNKSLMDDVTALINPYQQELTKLDANVRTELIEQDMIDGANKKKQNFFFPNDNQVPLPSVPDGIWKFLTPFSGSIAIGKNYLQAFPSTTVKEQDKIDAVNAQIAIIEAAIAGTRSTGLECNEDTSGTCSGEDNPPQTTQAACEADNGTWTPSGGPDSYSPNAVIQQALIDIVAALNDWKTFVQSEKTIIQTVNGIDTDATRLSENNAAIADIDNLISVVDNWLLYPDWDTTTTLPTGSGGTACAAFAAMVSTDFVSSKLRQEELQEIKDEITDRVSFISTRTTQLTTYLGSVGQDLGTGELNGSGSGLYDKRFKVINVRLNLLGGSLNKLLSVDKGKDAQDSIKATNNNTLSLYNDVMKVSAFKAPASNTGTIHVHNASDFTSGDSVYIVADNQVELSGTISSINNNTIFLDISIPEKYNHNNSGRIYKII